MKSHWFCFWTFTKLLRLSNTLIVEALQYFGFRENFNYIISTLYSNINSCVSLAQGTSPRFDVKCGIRQGCLISPFLFLIATELLDLFLVNCVNVEVIKIGDSVLTISQLADDTCLFLQHELQVPNVIFMP